MVWRWLDTWFHSDAVEWLEAHGASGQGERIVDELNSIYQNSGLASRLVGLLAEEASRIHVMTARPIRVLQVGMRDGMMLRKFDEYSLQRGIPVELHGVEFRENLVRLARERCRGQIPAAHFHLDPTRNLEWAAAGSFDLVFSQFMLHHLDQSQLKNMLLASARITRFALIHFDLIRSFTAALLTWLYYTTRGYRHSRRDAVLSCRRAYLPRELTSIVKHLDGVASDLVIRRRFPFYLEVIMSKQGKA